MFSNENENIELLVSEFKRGSRSSFDEIVKLYKTMILNYIWSYVKDPHLAEDITQDVFVKFYNSPYSYRSGTNFSAFLYTMARNASLNHLRRSKIEVKAYKSIELDGSQSPSDLASENEIKERVRKEVTELPEIYRDAVVLVDMNGASYIDAASALGIDVKALCSRLLRGRKMLKEKLQEYV